MLYYCNVSDYYRQKGMIVTDKLQWKISRRNSK